MKTTHKTRKKFMKEDTKIYAELVHNKRDRNTKRHLHEPKKTQEKSPVALAIETQLFHK